MKRIGICDSHDASLVLVEDEKIVFALSEERLTRRKRQQGFPVASIHYMMKKYGNHVDTVIVSGRYGRGLFRLCNSLYTQGPTIKNILSPFSRFVACIENFIARTFILKTIDYFVSYFCLKRMCHAIGLSFEKIILVDHHSAHLISAMSGVYSERFIAASFDAYGDAKSAHIVCVQNKKILYEQTISYKHSIARLYGVITAYLGFSEGDEGKVMALADLGKETECVQLIHSLFNLEKKTFRLNQSYLSNDFKRRLFHYAKPDIAFALQRVVESLVRDIFSLILNTCNFVSAPDLLLAGGLFSNVKINQKLKETGLFKNIFINPYMSDGGCAFAALKESEEFVYNSRDVIQTVNLGPSYDDEKIKNILDTYNICYTYCEAIETHIAVLLSEGHVIARFNGPMEFGPRALGNRSILYQTNDVTVLEWLNKRLHRDTFMPFAPITLDGFQRECYLDIDDSDYVTPYMTMSFQCTDYMKRVSPNVVHVDGSARVQIVRQSQNPSLFKVLTEYYRLTQIPSLINTSFNMHGEPIVCTPHDAIDTFLRMKLDYLAIGSYLIKLQ
jgi:carbamoyltransferase